MELIGVNGLLFMYAEKDAGLKGLCEVFDASDGTWIKDYKIGSWLNHCAGWKEPTEDDKKKADYLIKRAEENGRD